MGTGIGKTARPKDMKDLGRFRFVTRASALTYLVSYVAMPVLLVVLSSIGAGFNWPIPVRILMYLPPLASYLVNAHLLGRAALDSPIDWRSCVAVLSCGSVVAWRVAAERVRE
jgi:hypothetical protein